MRCRVVTLGSSNVSSKNNRHANDSDALFTAHAVHSPTSDSHNVSTYMSGPRHVQGSNTSVRIPVMDHNTTQQVRLGKSELCARIIP